MENNEKISVIIPVYNVAGFIHQCVESVINQTYYNLEIILIDDGSHDDCPQICDNYSQADDRIIVIHKDNGGLASARNVGLDTATGSLVFFVDSDDWIEKEAFQRMVDMKEKTSADIVCCEGVHTDGTEVFDRCFCCKPTGTIISGEEATREILLDRVGSQVVKGLYERKCWEGIRFPAGMLYEDISTTFRVFDKADRIAYVDAPFYNYRVNNSSISWSPNPLKPYHQYLGFKSHYDYSKLYYPDISDACCSITAHYGISTLFHSYTDCQTSLDRYVVEVRDFLLNHRDEIKYEYMPKSRSYALKLFYYSESLFRLLAKIFYRLGLQGILGFKVK